MALPRTRLHPPTPRRELVARPRLVDRMPLPAGPLPRLVLVAAPAGFGKTTLLGQWLARHDESLRVAWLSLDGEDSDPQRFLADVVAALRAAAPDVGVDAEAFLPAGGAAVMVSLINDIDRLDGALVLALDDYHVIESPEVHDAVTFLLDHLPGNASVAVTTRADPPLPVARLRARGELLELRAADLRFTPPEAAAFLNDVMGLRLDPDDVGAREGRTEGWAAGLQLAALSLRGRRAARPGTGAAPRGRPWYAVHDRPEDAIAHAVAEHDVEHAADLIEHALPEARRQQRHRTIRRWARAMPDDVVRRRPILAVTAAWSRLGDGEVDDAEVRLRAAEETRWAPPGIVGSAA